MNRKPGRLESDEQRELAQRLDALGLRWFHVPNEGKRNVAYAVELKRRGVKPGVPDNFILTPPPKFPEIRGLVIELKREKGGKPSPSQIEWLENLQQIGWAAVVCHGIEDCLKTLKYYGYIKGA